MNAPITAASIEAQRIADAAAAEEDARHYRKQRLAIAKDLLAGLLAGGKCHSAMNWEEDAVRTSLRLADRLIYRNQEA